MAVFPSKVNFATGDVLTATNMNDVGNAINTLNGSQIAAGKNAVLNSGMNIWQRGTSISLAASSVGSYTADRWQTSTGTNQACTVSRQATGDTTNLPNIQYCMRYQRNSGQTGTAALALVQSMETINSVGLAGKTVTFSFYARAGANYSAAAGVLTVYLLSGTGTDQNRLTAGYTGDNFVVASTATLTTTWQRFTYTATVPATATEIAPYFSFTPVGTAGTNDYFELTGVQLEQANTASPYAPNGATYQAELAACQRYYFRFAGGQTFSRYGTGYSSNTNTAFFNLPLPVSLRVSPTAVDYSTLILDNGFGTSAAVTAVTLTANCQSPTVGSIGVNVASGLTADRNYQIENNGSTAGYIGFTAEL